MEVRLWESDDGRGEDEYEMREIMVNKGQGQPIPIPIPTRRDATLQVC